MRLLSFISLLLLSLPLAAEPLDMDEYLYGHVMDSYEWHITTVKGHPVSVPLPVIVYSSQSGWHCFPHSLTKSLLQSSTETMRSMQA